MYALDGIHYFDDAIDLASNIAPMHAHLMLKSNHNFFNLVWSPNSGIPGAGDDWSDAGPPRSNDQHCAANVRLTEDQQRSSSVAYMTAFFYSYLNPANDSINQYKFYRHLTSDANPPSAVQQAGAKTYVSYFPDGNNQYHRRVIDKFINSGQLTQNNIGGVVTANALDRYALCGVNAGIWCQDTPYIPDPNQPNLDPREPHQSVRQAGQAGLLGAALLRWTNNASAWLDNAIPDGYGLRDFTRFESIQFRAAVNFQDSTNPIGSDKNLQVSLTDTLGRQASVNVTDIYQSPKLNPLFFPPGTWPQNPPGPPTLQGGIQIYPVPRLIMDTVRIPLSAFQNVNTPLDLAAITNVTVKFNQSPTGDIVLRDLSLTNSSCIAVTPPPGTGNFQDVPTGNTFYTYIHALGAAGIMSGYDCGQYDSEPCVCPTRNLYFRYGNQVTRGQLAKIAVLAAGWSETYNTQAFEDVLVGSTFYQFIERLYSRGFIHGYPCGIAPAPACVPPANRPFFLPNSSVKRDQIAQIVAGAANFTDYIPPDRHTFADVPHDGAEASQFWRVIERMAQHGAMTGYACGSQALPCDPQNRPYFLPWNPTTRGQAAKIIAIAFNVGLNIGGDGGFEQNIPGAVPTGQIPVDIPPAVPTVP